MPLVYRPWISPYGDDDFVWERNKSLATFDDRELYGRVTAIIYTPRRGKCRIISLRPANTVEREIYYEYTAG
jgi:uncharacterized DUF497 family protein